MFIRLCLVVCWYWSEWSDARVRSATESIPFIEPWCDKRMYMFSCTLIQVFTYSLILLIWNDDTRTMLEIWGFKVIVESNITPKLRACDEGVICESPIVFNIIHVVTFFLSSFLSKPHFCLHCSHVCGGPYFFSEFAQRWHLLPIKAAITLQYSQGFG